MKRVNLVVLVAALAAGVTQVSNADTLDGQPLSRRVSYSDINLTRAAGARVLYQRLMAAADVVCGPADNRDLARVAKHKDCVQSAMSAAVADVNSPLLSAYYQSKGGEAPQQKVAQLVK